MKQYTVLRAVGMSNGQLVKMIAAETITYAAAGGIAISPQSGYSLLYVQHVLDSPVQAVKGELVNILDGAKILLGGVHLRTAHPQTIAIIPYPVLTERIQARFI